MTTTPVPSHIRHLGICAHAQTPYARRACRRAALAAAQTIAAPAYRAGDEIVIEGVTIALGSRLGSRGVRWNWVIPMSDEGSEGYYPTPEAAIDHARRALAGPRCSCGAPATMHASTRRTCPGCYDRYAA